MQMSAYSQVMKRDRRTPLVCLQLFSILVYFVAVGCCKRFDSAVNDEDQKAAAWTTASWSGKFDWKELYGWKYVDVRNVPDAMSQLQEASWVSLTPDKARYLVGQDNIEQPIGIPYLMRGVRDHEDRFPIEIFLRPTGELWIAGEANSKCPVPRHRVPVVVWLSKAPGSVYVTFFVNKD
jgi:hypothetical protein